MFEIEVRERMIWWVPPLEIQQCMWLPDATKAGKSGTIDHEQRT